MPTAQKIAKREGTGKHLRGKKEASMATATMTKRPSAPAPVAAPIPRALRAQAEGYLALNYAFMDSPIYKQRGIEKELFDFEHEPSLPMTSWYQPTREDLLN